MIDRAPTDASRPVAVSPDEVLIGEIAPAMRAKLQGAGRIWGRILGALALFLVESNGRTIQALVTSEFGWGIPAARLASHVAALLAALVLFALPVLVGRFAIRQELRYRRHHGKWRWER